MTTNLRLFKELDRNYMYKMNMFFYEACQLWKQTKKVLIYLKGIEGLSIYFESSKHISRVGFIDSVWGGSDEGLMSTSGWSFFGEMCLVSIHRSNQWLHILQ